MSKNKIKIEIKNDTNKKQENKIRQYNRKANSKNNTILTAIISTIHLVINADEYCRFEMITSHRLEVKKQLKAVIP